MRTLVLNAREKDKIKDLPVPLVETENPFFKTSNSIILCSGSVCASRPLLNDMTVWHILSMGTLTKYFNIYYKGKLLSGVELRSATLSGVLDDGSIIILTRDKRVSLEVKGN